MAFRNFQAAPGLLFLLKILFSVPTFCARNQNRSSCGTNSSQAMVDASEMTTPEGVSVQPKENLTQQSFRGMYDSDGVSWGQVGPVGSTTRCCPQRWSARSAKRFLWHRESLRQDDTPVPRPPRSRAAGRRWDKIHASTAAHLPSSRGEHSVQSS